jgi:hypothetical protein
MNAFEAYQQFCTVETDTVLMIREFADVPRRTHRRPRIQKKWLKRYGTIRKLVHSEDRPIRAPSDIHYSEIGYLIGLRMVCRPTRQTVTLPVLDRITGLYKTDIAAKASDPVRIETQTIELKQIGVIQHMPWEAYRHLYFRPESQRMYLDNFWREARRLIEAK